MGGDTPNLPNRDALQELSSRYVNIDQLPWVKGGAEGIEHKILLQDKERGISTILIKWAPGTELPLHEHLDYEQTFVLEGTLCDHEGECTAGNYVWRPPGSRHRAWSPTGCLLLAIFLAPNKFLEGRMGVAMPGAETRTLTTKEPVGERQ